MASLQHQPTYKSYRNYPDSRCAK